MALVPFCIPYGIKTSQLNLDTLGMKCHPWGFLNSWARGFRNLTPWSALMWFEGTSRCWNFLVASSYSCYVFVCVELGTHFVFIPRFYWIISTRKYWLYSTLIIVLYVTMYKILMYVCYILSLCSAGLSNHHDFCWCIFLVYFSVKPT